MQDFSIKRDREDPEATQLEVAIRARFVGFEDTVHQILKDGNS